jgi:hypothetical protein
MKLSVISTFSCILMASSAYASVVDFSSGYTLLETVQTDGLLLWNNSWTWNGAPRTETNFPSDSQARLRADINLFASVTDGKLFVQVKNVITTQDAFWFGGAIDGVTMTGVVLERLPSGLPSPQFSFAYANAAETLLCCGPTEVATALNDTPGYGLTPTTEGLLINTSNGSDFGFTSLPASLRRGDTRPRIDNGGVFLLDFGSNANLLSLDWTSLKMGAEYGAGRQYIGIDAPSFPTTPPPPADVPEPPEIMLLLGAISASGVRRWLAFGCSVSRWRRCSRPG